MADLGRVLIADDEETFSESTAELLCRQTSSVSLDTFLELTFQNITNALSDLKYLMAVLAEQTKDKQPCHLFNCPRLESLTDGLAETVDVLKGTKSAFKSKNLGEIRRKLETLIQSKP